MNECIDSTMVRIHVCLLCCLLVTIRGLVGLSRIQRLDPRLVAVLHDVAQPTMASLSCHKYSTNFARQEQKVFYFTLIDRSSPGFKVCSSFRPSTTSYRHRIFQSDYRLQYVFNVSNLLVRIGSV